LFALGGPTLLAAYALTFAVYFGRNALLQTYLPLLGGTVLGLPAWSIGLAIGGQSLFGAVATIGAGLLADRFGRAVVMLPGLVLLLLGQGALLLVRDVEGFYAVVLFQAVGFTLNALPASLVGDALPRAYGGLGIAGYRLVADAAILAAPLVMGVALDYTGYSFPVVLLLAVTTLCAVVAMIALRRGQPTRVLAQG
jgi:MFS family permease